MKTYFTLFISLLVFSMNTKAQTMKYVDEAYLQKKELAGTNLQMVLSAMAIDGQYQLSNAYLSEIKDLVEVGKKSDAISFILIPAAKISYADNGIGSIQGKYIGADGIEYNAPDEEWNKFAFFAQKETVQLYFLQIEVKNRQTDQIEKKYLTSIEAGKMNFQSAIAGNDLTALSQMFAIQGNLNVDVFQPPYYGIFIFSPVVYFSGNNGSINTIVGSDNLKDGPVINLTTYSNDSLFVLSDNRNTCEFALMKSNAVRVTDVILNEESIILINDNPEEQRMTLTATILPENASDKSVRWISSNEDIVTVSETGEISAKSTGRAYIKATSNDGMISDSCLFIVKTLSGLIVQENAIITDASGSIDFSFEAPTTNIHSATFNIKLPSGYRLTDNGINLADELTSLLSANVVSVGNNEWKIDLNPTELALTTKSAAIYKKMLDINYTVDANLGNGSYDIILKSIDIKSGNDLYIQEEQLIVPSNILRNTTGNQSINEGVSVFCNNGTLIINTNRIEKIQIYSITGTLLYSGQINGTTSIPADNFTDIFVVKNSSGWVKKVVKQ